MGKIATYQYLYDNFGYKVIYPNTYSQCPTYQDIKNASEFTINGTYSNNQLVQEADIVEKIRCYIIFMGLLGYDGQMRVQYQTSTTNPINYMVIGSPDPDYRHGTKAISGIKITSVSGTIPINTSFMYSMSGKLQDDRPSSAIQMTAGTWYNFSGATVNNPFIVTITGRAV